MADTMGMGGMGGTTEAKMDAERARFKSDMDAMKSDLQALRRDFMTLGRDLLDATKGGATEAGHRAREEAERRMEQMHDMYDRARDTGRQYVDQAQSTIEERPLTSVLVAFGVGILLGKLLDRR